MTKTIRRSMRVLILFIGLCLLTACNSNSKIENPYDPEALQHLSFWWRNNNGYT